MLTFISSDKGVQDLCHYLHWNGNGEQDATPITSFRLVLRQNQTL